MIWKREEVNTNNGVKLRRFIVPKKVEQINEHLFMVYLFTYFSYERAPVYSKQNSKDSGRRHSTLSKLWIYSANSLTSDSRSDITATRLRYLAIHLRTLNITYRIILDKKSRSEPAGRLTVTRATKYNGSCIIEVIDLILFRSFILIIKFVIFLIHLRSCQHDYGYIDSRSQIKVHTDERTQVHSAQSSLTVTHPSNFR